MKRNETTSRSAKFATLQQDKKMKKNYKTTNDFTKNREALRSGVASCLWLITLDTINMKTLFLSTLFLVNFCFAQTPITYRGFDEAVHHPEIIDLEGMWTIRPLITDTDNREYTLSGHRNSIQQGFNRFYGDNAIFKSDGTFENSHSEKCGNGSPFISAKGRYKIIDENYLCFSLQKSKTDDEDLGLFRIYREDNKIHLVKSDGNPENDKKSLQYIEMLNSKSKELPDYNSRYMYGFSDTNVGNLIDWKKSDSDYRFEKWENIVDFITKQKQITDYEILFNKNFDRGTFILIKTKNEYCYIWREPFYGVALFDSSFFKKIDCIHLSEEINRNENLQKKTIYLPDTETHRTDEFSRNKLFFYKENDEIKKIVYVNHIREGKQYSYIYYLKEGKPIVIKASNSWGGKNYFYFPTIEHYSDDNIMEIPEPKYPKYPNFLETQEAYNYVMKIIKNDAQNPKNQILIQKK
jgi:hypothetical protein